ncbi:MAG: helix-turn-helix domain-containing protein, partial [Acholeplasmataceae bacterium]|nr:helix-turn-helix domain-containing protein [Acholeplasmataceae bacterium]
KKMSNKHNNNQTINKSVEKSNLLDLSFIDTAEKYSVEFFNVENTVSSVFVKELRNKLNMSQVFFAKVLGVSNKTIEKWEQGKNPITGTAARLLLSISMNPELIKNFYRETWVTSTNENTVVRNVYSTNNLSFFVAEGNLNESNPEEVKKEDQKQ